MFHTSDWRDIYSKYGDGRAAFARTHGELQSGDWLVLSRMKRSKS